MGDTASFYPLWFDLFDHYEDMPCFERARQSLPCIPVLDLSFWAHSLSSLVSPVPLPVSPLSDQTIEQLKEALTVLQAERDSINRRFQRRGDRLVELQELLSQYGLAAAADQTLRRAERRAEPVTGSPRSLRAIKEESPVRPNVYLASKSAAPTVSAGDALSLAQQINNSSFAQVRTRALSISAAPTAERRRMSDADRMQRARMRARNRALAGDLNNSEYARYSSMSASQPISSGQGYSSTPISGSMVSGWFFVGIRRSCLFF